MKVEYQSSINEHDVAAAVSEADAGETMCVHEMFEAQAERTPEAAAVNFKRRKHHLPRIESLRKSACAPFADARQYA